MSISVIPAELKHIDAIVSIETECFPDPWSKNSFVHELTAKHSFLYAAVNEAQEVVGFASMWHIVNEGQINNIAVAPRFRKLGAAAALIEAMIQTAISLEMIGLTLEVRISNKPAICLYEKYGFKPEGLRKNYYEKPKEDAIIMWKYMEENYGS